MSVFRGGNLGRTVAAGMALAALIGTSALAGGFATPAGAAGYTNLVTLKTSGSASAALTYWDPDGLTSTQSLINPDSTKCYATSNPSAIVDFYGTVKGSTLPTTPGTTPTYVGQRFDSIGVAEKSSGESCGQVGSTGSEALTLDLKGKTAALAVLDLELQQNAVVVASLFKSPSTSAFAKIELQTGRSIGGSAQPGSTRIEKCQVESSSGPNSGPSDNCRWVIAGGLFDKVVLAAAKGQFSLEGGADGTITNRSAAEPAGYPTDVSYFSLSSPCTKDVTVDSGEQSDLSDKITVTQWNADTVDGQQCQTTPLIVKAQDGALEFIKNGQPYSQFKVVIDWRYALKSKVTATTVQFGSGDPVDVMAWCPDSVRTTDSVKPLDAATGDLATYLSTNGITDMDPTTDGVQFACTGLKTAATYVNPEVGDDYIAQTETIYLLGDVVWRG